MVGRSKTCFLPLILLLFAFLFLETINFGSCSGDFNVGCIEIERKALVKLKASLIDPSGRLFSWVGEDCCRWKGVKCSNSSGRVLKLKLGNLISQNSLPDDWTIGDVRAAYNKSSLSGQINPSLLDLKHLIYLDLSYNNFGGIPVPKLMGSLKKLRYLNLSNAGFGGTIPSHLGNLSSLRYLDLNSFESNFALAPKVNNLLWLPGLSFLKYLDMGFIDLSNATLDWLEAVNKLPSLSELHLSDCRLVNLPPLLSSVNFTSLAILDLSGNYFYSSIPYWMSNISTLSVLNLCYARINGKITEFVDGLSRCRKSQLQVLNLAMNELSGHLPESIGDLLSLQVLDLSYNNMNGIIPDGIGQLSQLDTLGLYSNTWDCVITKTHFQNLTKLKIIKMGRYFEGTMTFRFQVSNDWIPPFSLQDIWLENIHLGPNFPTWLRTQNELGFILLINVGISGTTPDWLWKSFPKMYYLNLLGNQISGKLPKSLKFSTQQPITIRLSDNKFEGPIPVWPMLNHLRLFLGNNMLSGSIPQNIWELMPHLTLLDLSGNHIDGNIPSSISKLKFLSALVLSDNHLFGELPRNWSGMEDLSIVDFSNNNLSGQIPSSMRFLTSLQWLILRSNNFDGELPSLQNFKQLVALDVSENKFSTNLPTWMRGIPSTLGTLRLRSNLLIGSIPRQVCLLSKLHILDLADNNLSGVIPQCLGNLTGMVSTLNVNQYILEQTPVVTKGTQRIYSGDSLRYGKFFDLSKNNLWGEIPWEITRLFGLVSLNLSMNHLSGMIPEKIGSMRNLESLDLSRNHLFGPIPQTMSSLTFLSFLNLSYNNLSGRIPLGSQLQTLNDSFVYMGNPSLCGQPLATKCPGDEKDQDPALTDTLGREGNKDGDGVSEMLWFYASMAVGFVVGLWGVCGTLLMKRSWRHAYFQSFEDLKDRLVLIVALNVARLQRKIASQRN